MKTKLLLCQLLFSLFFTSSAKSQIVVNSDTLATISMEDEQKLLKADELFEFKNYVGAMSLFDALSIQYPQSVLFKFKTGICFLHASSKHDKALEYLLDVKNRNPEIEAIDYYLGRAYLYNYRYDDAIRSFTKYSEIPARKNENKFDISHFIDYCNNGKVVIQDPVSTYIDNIGKPINTDNSEYVPVISSDESFMIFTYRGERSKGGKQNARNRADIGGEFYEDIFISYRIGDHWLYPEPLGNINSNNHDAAIAISVDGQKLFVFKATKKDKGDIYLSQLKGSDWSEPKRLNKNINSNYWEGSITMTNDESIIYFTSARPGGFGGRDIYKSKKQTNGEWGPAENLGPLVNTKYNEDAPFIHPDNKLFFFSSEGHNSIGGYDIFKSEVKGDSLGKPENLGFPVNTSTDDKYISISTNGARAYYSSGVDEGLGQQDIYTITPGIPGKKPQVAIVKGLVTGNEKPIKASIKVTNTAGTNDFGTFYSNSESGNYLLVLLPKNNYKISYQADGYKTHNEYVNTISLNKTVEVKEDIHLYTLDYTFPKVESKDTVGFIFARLEEEISKLDGMDVNDDKLMAMAREREEERKSGLSKTSTSFRVATDETIKKILAQNASSTASNESKNRQVDLAITESKSNVSASTEAGIAAKTDSSSQTAALEPTKAESLTNKATTEENNSPELGIEKAAKNGAQENSNTPIFGVFYKVQIGAYRHPENFKYSQLKSLGTAETLLLKDGITRFTMGNFETLAEAKKLQQTIVSKGIKDAWITATVNGERKLLEEVRLMKLKVIN